MNLDSLLKVLLDCSQRDSIHTAVTLARKLKRQWWRKIKIELYYEILSSKNQKNDSNYWTYFQIYFCRNCNLEVVVDAFFAVKTIYWKHRISLVYCLETHPYIFIHIGHQIEFKMFDILKSAKNFVFIFLYFHFKAFHKFIEPFEQIHLLVHIFIRFMLTNFHWNR